MALINLSELKSLKNTYISHRNEKGILYLEGEFVEGRFVTNDATTRIINNPCVIRNFNTSLIEDALYDDSGSGRYNVKILLNITNSFPKNSSLSFPDDCFYLFFNSYITDYNYSLGITDTFHISLKVDLKGTHVDCLTSGTHLLVADNVGSPGRFFFQSSDGATLGHSFDSAVFELVYPKPKVWFGTLDRYNSLTTKYDDVLYLFESY